MTDLVKETIEKAKEKAISTISQYRTDVFTSMISLRIEMNSKGLIGIPHEQEDYDLSNPKDFDRYIKDVKSEVRGSFEYREMDESLKYIDKLMEKIKEIEFE